MWRTSVGTFAFQKCPPSQLVGFQGSIFLLTQPCDQAGRQEHPHLWGGGEGGVVVVGWFLCAMKSQSKHARGLV